MAWTVQMRATSFVVTVAMVLCSSSVVLFPVATALWLGRLLDAGTAFAIAAILACGYALAVALYTHMTPPSLGSNGESTIR
jgi:hypothetical protein